jgi:hypothetical protein
MREESQSLGSFRGGVIVRRLAFLAPVFGHGAGDGLVETQIQGAKIGGADRRILLDRQLRDRLAHVPVVVHHLRHREPPL